MKAGYQREYYIVEDPRNSIGRPDKGRLYQTEGGSKLIPTSGGEEDEEEYSHSPAYAILNLRKFDFS
jgi:hypothetical protein